MSQAAFSAPGVVGQILTKKPNLPNKGIFIPIMPLPALPVQPGGPIYLELHSENVLAVPLPAADPFDNPRVSGFRRG